MDRAVTVENLSKTYRRPGGAKVSAIDSVSFQVPSGSIFGLLGPNGAGKTTTVKSICGLIKPDSGTISVHGHDVFRQRTLALQQVSAVLEGNRNIYWRLTPKENLKFLATIRGRTRRKLKAEIEELLTIFGLEAQANQPVRKLSRGMQQKLAIAITLISKAPVLLLDEPTLGLDVKVSYEVRKLLQRIVSEHKRAIIVTTHNMNVVEDICEQVVIINEGRVVANDRTENLLKLFQARSYHLTVGSLSDEQQRLLTDIPHLSLEQQIGEWRIALDIEVAPALWPVLDLLRQEETVIESITRQELNFEKVFLELMGGDEA